ncbi:multi-copper polyphenol oxidoreductase laccase [Aliarcobacter butzleri 7h1h]|jgi:YfiH family protein|uniref:Purine nucleoside phosphorylase n=1 Tax=Aliarcobacter butzleri TaxID=28197 RepID=A0AAW6VKV5_9BACT|nr:peptidoglycan editing factor PgeF [Aliarcobacter butzleri]AGR77374.1 multi-copper polyphenol oxidoreductase laccase [Aliarcobacter butzleri 7h1h]MCG3703238.1 peptidoglycan editing factor PgeF [Aliarcobacter butzleri]MDK2061427.1 peptidoglycan editing factor PgeF [Aliarcobacter butzleri]MDK2069398.1 peptidoglycan editing factor PgeF [Aliarcobacter butzleri]MDS1370014.1 peptidoglycan editing factor PgeF [Aliarcobacter butzleri]
MGVKYFFSDKTDGNLAYHVGDIKENVDKNRQKLALKYDYKDENLCYMNQIHSANVVVVDENSPKYIDNCDALITKTKNLPLMVMVADCIPILMFDEVKGVIAAIHAGRNSTFLKISEITSKKMIEDFSCKTENIKVIMGPSIQKCCYEVNDELKNIVEKSFGKEFVIGNNIDLQGINKKLLENLGIKNIEISSICTKCSNKPFFSYRKEKNTGRFAGVITFK